MSRSLLMDGWTANAAVADAMSMSPLIDRALGAVVVGWGRSMCPTATIGFDGEKEGAPALSFEVAMIRYCCSMNAYR